MSSQSPRPLPRFQNFGKLSGCKPYITKNAASSLVYEKLIRTCNYFFFASEFILLKDYSLPYRCEDKQKWLQSFLNVEYLTKDAILDLHKAKIWLSGSFVCAVYDDPDLVSLIVPYVSRCDITEMIIFDQHLSMDDFLFLSKNLKNLHFNDSLVCASNRQELTMGDILTATPTLESLLYSSSTRPFTLHLSDSSTIPKHPKPLKITLRSPVDLHFEAFAKFVKLYPTNSYFIWYTDEPENFLSQIEDAIRNEFPQMKTLCRNDGGYQDINIYDVTTSMSIRLHSHG